MIADTKCECGHQNSVGTVLCEACGKPLFDDEGTAPLEMRYDGVARRSQKANPSILDRIWNFFSSVRNAVWIIFATLCASILGTVYPQENTLLSGDPAVFYSTNYGQLGEIYYALGLSHTFNTWWYKLLLLMIGASLVICSLDRVLPLYRALSKQKVRKHLRFITRQRVVYQGEIRDPEGFQAQVVEELKKKRYRIYTDSSEGGAILAEKNRFSRWGPYINHIGLIIFLLALLMRGIPGWYMDQYAGFVEGVPQKIPETEYYLKNEKFTVEYYSEEELPKDFQGQGRLMPKLFETKAILYTCLENCGASSSKAPVLEEVHRADIIVNDPLNYKGLFVYQFDYSETPQLHSINASITDLSTNQTYGKFLLDFHDPEQMYEVGPYHLELRGFYPDFGLNDAGSPITNSNNPNAPALIFHVTGPNLPEEGSVYIYFPREVDKLRFSQDRLNGEVANLIKIGAESMEDVGISSFTSFLNIRIDKALPYIFAGSGIFIIGVVMGVYWQHRRIWIRIDKGNQVSLGAHTNKNWFGLKKEVASIVEKVDGDIRYIAERGVDQS